MEVTIMEAAERLHISQATVRRRLRNGLLEGRKQHTPQGFTWSVTVDEETTWPGQPDHTELVAALQERIAAQEDELVSRRQEISELHRLMAVKALEAGRRPWWKFW